MVRFFTWLNNRLTLQDPIITYTGAADSGKIPALNAAGVVNATLVEDLSPVGSPEGLQLVYTGTGLTFPINIATGRAVIPGTNRAIAVLSSVLSKQVNSAWAAGNGVGGKFAGTISANQTWHVFIIRNTTTGAVDAGFDLSVTGANIPSGWVGRIIGSFMIDGAGTNVRPFVQNGDLFQWTTVVQDFNSVSATPTSTSNLLTLTVPSGLSVVAFGRIGTYNTASSSAIYAASPGITPDAVVFANTANSLMIGRFEFATNTSAQIRFYAETAASFGQLFTWGFIHPRGAY